MSAISKRQLQKRVEGQNNWLSLSDSSADGDRLLMTTPREIDYVVMPSEEAVGYEMLKELEETAHSKDGDLVIILLGGRGAQALHRILGNEAKGNGKDWLLNRLHVFTQDALAPLRLDNQLSFVRDFERLLGDDFFRKVKSFTCMRTDSRDLEEELKSYIAKLESLGGIDIFFVGLGPEAGGASHLAYIKPKSGARVSDVAGLIPISESILEHHISKFKAGGTLVDAADEAECRAATHILTLGPAAIIGARKIVQSIVDAATAPAKRESYARLLETRISDQPAQRAKQLDENPCLWLRLHPNVKSFILSDVIAI